MKEQRLPNPEKSPNDRFLDYLQQIDGSAQPGLFRNILHNEVERRRNEGEQPQPNDYAAAVPKFAELVHQVFQESVDTSRANSTSIGPNADPLRTVDHIPLAAKVLGEFEILRKLGQGGFGEVFEARHLSRGDRVALKTLPTQLEDAQRTADNVGRLRQFKNEFRALADINHRHLVGLQTLEEDGGQYFFTMDLVDGTDFLNHVRSDNQLDEQRLRSVLSQLVSGVIALHGHQIIHRDLKPNNVMVDRDGQVKILDFGLVVDLAQNIGMTAAGLFDGTPAYAAPEQAVGERSFASDWYAVGVMLYEALVGRWPHGGQTGAEVLRKKQDKGSDSIIGEAHVPDDLAKPACGCSPAIRTSGQRRRRSRRLFLPRLRSSPR
jgi:serine/threonine protein kinase